MIQYHSRELLNLGGLAVKLSDIRGFIFENGLRNVILQNGMKIALTESERISLQKALNLNANKIVREARKSGVV